MREPGAAFSGPTVPRSLTNALLHDATHVLCARDADLAHVVEHFGTPPLWARRPGFASLVRIILEQQVSLSSARATFDRVRTALGEVSPRTVRAAGPPGLRAHGFTRQKADYCVSLAELVDTGRLDLNAVARAPMDEARACLMAVRGLGPWSVDIYFLMALRRPDIWPHGDLALADAMRRVKGLPGRPDAETQARIASRWAPWRAVGARILWHYYLSTPRVREGKAR